MKIFRGFRVFEYALWQKTKTRKCRKSRESPRNKKAPSVNSLPLLENSLKATNFYLTNILALIARKVNSKLQW